MKLQIVAGCRSVKGREVSIKKGTPGTLLFKSNPWAFSHKSLQVTVIDWVESGSRSVGKAAAGAIIGGVLTGGLGLLAGAAIGAGKKDTSTAVITLQNGEQLRVRATAREFEKLNTWI